MKIVELDASNVCFDIDGSSPARLAIVVSCEDTEFVFKMPLKAAYWIELSLINLSKRSPGVIA